jgi:hypothetical protein
MPSPKNGVTDNWGLASADGTRAAAGAAFPQLSSGEGGPPLIDEEGRLWVREGGPAPGFNARWQASSGALTNDEQIIAGAALLEQVSGFVQAASDAVNFVQIYDLAAVPAGVPVQTIRIVGSQVWSWSPQRWQFSSGVRFAVSSSAIAFVAGDVAFYNALGWSP